MQSDTSGGFFSRAQRYLLAGVLTAIPIWITWLIFEFFFGLLAQLGRPGVLILARAVEPGWPILASWLLDLRLQSVVGILVTLAVLYLLGWLATRVLGRQLLGVLDAIIDRIPLVKKVYGAIKQLMRVLEQKPDGLQRVVLVDFPHPEMRAVGFVMKIFKEQNSGREMAAVYVPTTPNPTSGYLEIIPVERLTETSWSMDEAMTFIVSGGAVAPKEFCFSMPKRGSAVMDTDI